MARKQPQKEPGQDAERRSEEEGMEARVNNNEAEKKAELPADASSSDHSDGEKFDEARSSSQKDEVPAKKGSMLKNAWDKTGLNPGMLMMMFK